MSPPETCPSPADDPAVASADAISSSSLRDATANFQRRLVSEALRRCDGNQSRVAWELGMNRGNFSRLISKRPAALVISSGSAEDNIANDLTREAS